MLRQKRMFKRFEDWNLGFFLTRNTCNYRLKTCSVYSYWQTMKRSRTRSIRGFARDWKNFLQMASSSSWTKVKLCGDAVGLLWKMAVCLLMRAFRVIQKKINCIRLYSALVCLVFRSVITWGTVVLWRVKCLTISVVILADDLLFNDTPILNRWWSRCRSSVDVIEFCYEGF